MIRPYWSVTLVILIIIPGFGIFDLADDYRHGSHASHMIAEAVMVLICFEPIRRIVTELRRQRKKIQELQQKKADLSDELVKWKNDTRKIRAYIRDSIESQFRNWQLSQSESEVAFLILRGFSFDQIADLLKKSERTVRKQAGNIYEKAGFNSRAAFVGFFLEAIFELDDEPSFSVS